MKVCQNPACRENINRETALYCPYCGHYQNPTGWHYHQQALNTGLHGGIGVKPAGRDAHVLDLGATIRDCLVDGHILVALMDKKITAYDLSVSLTRATPHELWHCDVRAEARIVILRPYVVIIESNYIRCAHLDTGHILNLKLPDAAIEPELAYLKDYLLALPLETNFKNKQQAMLVFATGRGLVFLKFDARNQFAGYTVQSLGFHSALLTVHCDDTDDDALWAYSTSGERARLRISECMSKKGSSYIFMSKDDVYMKSSKPAGGYQIEWAHTKNGVTYFLERKNNGNTTFYRVDKDQAEEISTKTYTKKQPSAGREQPLILFELNGEFKNQLQGYDLLDRRLREYDLNAPRYFNIEHERFETLPGRLRYFAERYWALCPSLRPATSYHFVSMVFADERELKVEPHLYIPIEGLQQANGCFPMLPLILNHDQIVSYSGNKIIVIN